MKTYELPTVGRWLVDTEDATYDVDVDSGIVTRWDSAAEGAGAAAYETSATFMVDEVLACHVGERLSLHVWRIVGDDAVTERHTGTAVLGFTPHPVPVSA